MITTNETYFFRDEAQLDSFMKVMIPEVMKTNAGTKQIRIWSAACSTGDEPYTLALLLRDYPPLAGWTIDILATDISENVPEHRTDGHLFIPFVAQSSSGIARALFHREKGRTHAGPAGEGHGALHERESLRPSAVKTGTGHRYHFLPQLPHLFRRKAKAQIVSDLRDALRPKGYLMIGFSETLHDTSGLFKTIHAGRSVIHEKQ